MNNIIGLNENYSTTKLLTKEKVVLESRPENKFEFGLFLPKCEGRVGEGGLRVHGYLKKSYDDKPLISIITVVYNGEKYLEETIESVLKQTYPNIEYIIIDGGSTDRTLDIIKNYENDIDYWISEKDKGIYDAINKGISIAKGEYIGVIGADDIYYDDTLKYIAYYINKNQNIDLIYGNISYIDENGSIIKSKKSLEPRDSLFMIKGMSIPHIASFVKRSIYEKYGQYDVDMKCASDYQYFLNLFLQDISIKHLDVYISKFRNTGVTNNNVIQSNWEVFKIRQKYKVNIIINIYYFLRTILSKYIK